MYIIAEMSANHGKDIEVARRFVIEAANAGADAVKTQTYRPSSLTVRSGKSHFRVKNHPLWGDVSLWDLYENAYMPWLFNYELADLCEELGIDYISTAYCKRSLNFLLDKVGLWTVKIASFEMHDAEFMKHVAERCRETTRVLVSTGTANSRDLTFIQALFESYDVLDWQFLHCVSEYPTELRDANLGRLRWMLRNHDSGNGVGFSDHTVGVEAAIAAMMMGANIWEKHVKLDDGLSTADSDFSVPMSEFKIMVDKIRDIEWQFSQEGIGVPSLIVKDSPFARHLYWAQDLEAGTVIAPDEHVLCLRGSVPDDADQNEGTPIRALELWMLGGQEISRPVGQYEPVLLEDFGVNVQ